MSSTRDMRVLLWEKRRDTYFKMVKWSWIKISGTGISTRRPPNVLVGESLSQAQKIGTFLSSNGWISHQLPIYSHLNKGCSTKSAYLSPPI